ncbi:acyl-CoA carboxylase epsilon subunit [Streptomyces sp. NPDC046821]|uniref:acyl-CoA carboxylase epsilon subunit n=1 Tax=Streptomyces sp. NPDC046821 TaxID=3154702 RepID=UPI0033C07501
MMIKVVRGNPTPEELAAALAVVQARAALMVGTPTGTARTRDSWADPARLAQARRPSPGPASWARTYWPA